ncbi:alpha/beta fold hydrolase [Nakamurella aerolata]|uniref:alpha/beta fold hydrolase n=1 Tax=Nakamurella aerolata TaxID=1656892 RepID=UPI001BB23870
MSTLGKIIGTASVLTGAVGAVALGGVTAQRRAVRRYRQLAGDQDTGFDSLDADRSYTVAAPDGVALHVEEVGPVDAPLTVVFAHGWTLRLGAWHFQRIALSGNRSAAEYAARRVAATTAEPAGAGAAAGADPEELPGLPDSQHGELPDRELPTLRLVFFDQRSHGKSGRAGSGRSTIAALAEDLDAVLATAAPTGRVVLVGHSMGGMAILQLAADRPELFGSPVAGFALVDSSAQFASTSSRPALLGGNPLVRAVTATAGRYPRLFERGRPLTRDAVWLLTRSFGFADPNVPAAVVDYVDQMISSVPVDVIADFLPAVLGHDVREGLPVLAPLPGVVIVGQDDRMIPLTQSQALVDALPHTDLVVVPDAGHNVMLESPDVTTDALRELIRRVARAPEPAKNPAGKSTRKRSVNKRAGR